MTEIFTSSMTAYTIIIAGMAAIIFFFIGKVSGGIFEKKRLLNEQNEFEKRLSISESGKNDMRRQIEELKKQNEKYIS